MAWTDTCKIEARITVEKKAEEVGSIRGACKVVAKESGIPAETLRSWCKNLDEKSQAGEDSPTKQRAGEVLPDETKGPKSQNEIWVNVSRRLANLRKYIGKNCDIPAEMPPEIFLDINDHISFIHDSLSARDEDEDAHEQG